jgi:hypothetical protein
VLFALETDSGLVLLLLTLVDGSVESIVVFPKNGSRGCCPPLIFSPGESIIVFPIIGNCGAPPVIFNPENEEETLVRTASLKE